jgi:hypothetical protein
MIQIKLSNAENGIIKSITDSQYNGADQSVEIVRVYELDEEGEDYFDKISLLLLDISRDLGLNLGGNFDRDQLVFDVSWGEKYIPTIEEVNERIKELKEELKDLNMYKKEILSNND